MVVTRTTDLTRRGAYSAADPNLDLNKPGVWNYPKAAKAALWFPPQVRWCGAVEKSELEEVIAILRSLGRFRGGML